MFISVTDYDCSEELRDLESVHKEILQMTDEADNDSTKELEFELRQSGSEVKAFENDLSDIRSEIESLETFLQAAVDYEKELGEHLLNVFANDNANNQTTKWLMPKPILRLVSKYSRKKI